MPAASDGRPPGWREQGVPNIRGLNTSREGTLTMRYAYLLGILVPVIVGILFVIMGAAYGAGRLGRGPVPAGSQPPHQHRCS